jgi:hypothetical protein
MAANDYSTSTDTFADISEGNYTSSDYPQMAGFVTAASRLADLEFGRPEGFFYPSTDEVTLIYDGSGLKNQDIDEFVSISAVNVSEQGSRSSSDYTLWDPITDYMLTPYNYLSDGKPITGLECDVLNGRKLAFFGYPQSVRVTGIAGYSLTPPAIISLAVRMQSIRWFMRAKQGYQDSGANVTVGGLTFKGQLELDPDIKALLYPLKLELDR